MLNTLSHAEIEALKKEMLSSFHCALPGVVESFDPQYQTANIRPAVRTKFRGKAISLPVLKDVPVFFPGTRSAGITWPVSAGDECLVIFADLPIDAWLFGEEEDVSSFSRQHDLSDAFAFVGFRSKPNALPSFPDAPSFFGQESDS